jgi:hypothetical protein
MAQEETLKLAPLGLGFVPTITVNKVRKKHYHLVLEVTWTEGNNEIPHTVYPSFILRFYQSTL